MDKYKLIADEAEWVLKHYGSDAGESQNPGSKVRSQAMRIANFVAQFDQAQQLLAEYGLDLVAVTRRTI